MVKRKLKGKIFCDTWKLIDVLISASRNNVNLERSPTQLLTYSLWLLSSCKDRTDPFHRDPVACKAKNIYDLAFYRKHFPTPCLLCKHPKSIGTKTHYEEKRKGRKNISYKFIRATRIYGPSDIQPCSIICPHDCYSPNSLKWWFRITDMWRSQQQL